MKTQRFPFHLVAKAQLHHGGNEKNGNISMLRRNEWTLADGSDEAIPYISGNAARGVLRRLAARDLCQRLDFKPQSPRLYHLMTGGGNLEDGPLDIERVRAGVPLFSLLGGSCMSESFKGKLLVSNVLPRCSELGDEGAPSHYEIVDTVFGTRHDDGEAPENLDPGAGNPNSQQMIYEFEVFKPGTRFGFNFTLLDATPEEEACLGQIVALWRERPFIAARAAQGYAEIAIEGDAPDPQPYLDFLTTRRELCLDTLRWLDALRPPKAKN